MIRRKKKNPENAYFLVCFGEFKSNQKVIKKIANSVMPSVSSPTVKYYNNDLNIIYHFKSQHTFDDLKTFVDQAVTDYVGMYMLFTCNDGVSLGMPNDIYEYICDLENDNDPPQNLNVGTKDDIDEDYLEITSLIEKMKNEEIFMDDENDIEQILKKSQKEEQPSLDSLLDKISTTGMGSLTKKEKELLEYYSGK